MKKIQNFFDSLLAGRYGMDSLNKFLLYTAFVISLVRLFISSQEAMAVSGYLIWLILLIVLFRMFSKNLQKRYLEDIKFLKKTKPLRAEIELNRLRIINRGKVKYIKCPNCKTVVKAPAKVGKIKIKCRKCHEEFIKRV